MHSILLKAAAAAVVTVSAIGVTPAANAQTPTVFLGEIRLFPFEVCPTGWADLDGATLPIDQNRELFLLMGTTYGGDGVTTFGLPNMQGRFATHPGTGPNGATFALGDTGGAAEATMTIAQMPAHTHAATTTPTTTASFEATTTLSTQSGPTSGAFLGTAQAGGGVAIYTPTAGTNVDLSGLDVSVTATTTIGNTGGGASMPIQNPYVTLRYCMALEGGILG